MYRAILTATLLAFASCSAGLQGLPTPDLPLSDGQARTPGEDVVRPGPRPLEDAEQMRDFLAGSTFYEIPGREASWSFHEDGTFERRESGAARTGTWNASTERLLLIRAGADAKGSMLPLRWLDGKLNIEIDGVQYRRNSMD